LENSKCSLAHFRQRNDITPDVSPKNNITSSCWKQLHPNRANAVQSGYAMALKLSFTFSKIPGTTPASKNVGDKEHQHPKRHHCADLDPRIFRFGSFSRNPFQSNLLKVSPAENVGKLQQKIVKKYIPEQIQNLSSYGLFQSNGKALSPQSLLSEYNIQNNVFYFPLKCSGCATVQTSRIRKKEH
jgi:hypothetical protein